MRNFVEVAKGTQHNILYKLLIEFTTGIYDADAYEEIFDIE